MIKELNVKLVFDTSKKEVRDIFELILDIVDIANDDGVAIKSANIDNKEVFNGFTFDGVLKKKYWDWDGNN
jgi:hypothetical protein